MVHKKCRKSPVAFADACANLLARGCHADAPVRIEDVVGNRTAAGLNTRVDTWGPPSLEKMTKLFIEMNAYDIDTRISNEGRAPLVPLVHVIEGVPAGSTLTAKIRLPTS